MSQSRLMSAAEALSGVVAGFLVAVLVQALAFPAFGVEVSLAQNLGISSLFTGLSLMRGYVVRRVFARFTGGPR